MSLYKMPLRLSEEQMPHRPKKKLPSFDVGLQFIRERVRLCLSKQWLAEKADVGLLDVAMWETGPECLKPLQAILRALECKLVVTADKISLTKERAEE